MVECPGCGGKCGFKAPTPECPVDVWNECMVCDGAGEVTQEQADEFEDSILEELYNAEV